MINWHLNSVYGCNFIAASLNAEMCIFNKSLYRQTESREYLLQHSKRSNGQKEERWIGEGGGWVYDRLKTAYKAWYTMWSIYSNTAVTFRLWSIHHFDQMTTFARHTILNLTTAENKRCFPPFSRSLLLCSLSSYSPCIWYLFYCLTHSRKFNYICLNWSNSFI